jgi:hypothetical protein
MFIMRFLGQLLRDPAIGRAWVAEADGVAAGYMILTFNYDIEFGGMQGIVTYLEPELSPTRSRRASPTWRPRPAIG